MGLLRLLIYAGLLIISLILLLIFGKEDVLLLGLLTGLTTAFVLPVFDALLINWRYAGVASICLRYWRANVRVSVSYLYRIRVEDKYLLVRGKRIPGQFQPVGGVWKILPDARPTLDKLGVRDDEWVPVDETSRDDLRIRIKGRRLLEFLRWYEAAKGRETDPWREFQEELVGSGIVSAAAFPWIRYRHVKSYRHPVRFSSFAGGPEWLIAEIYELLPTDGQLDALRKLAESQADQYIWANQGQIERRAMEATAPTLTNIAITASWML